MSLWETFRNQRHDFTGRTPPAKRQHRNRNKRKLETNEEGHKLLQRERCPMVASVTFPVATTPSIYSSNQRRKPTCHSRFLACHHLVDEEITDAETIFLQMDRLGSYESQSQQRQRRTRRNRLALSLAHKKLMEFDQQKATKKDCYQDGSHAIYRKKEDYSGSQMYASCIFLNDHDRVLAADVSGKMDVVRVPVFPSGNNSKLLGTALLQELQIVGAGGSQPNQSTDTSSALKLQSLDQGNRFAVGMPNGNYCIVDTERMKATMAISEPSALNNTRRNRSKVTPPSTTLSYHTSLFPQLQAITVAGSRRKYHRDWSNPQLSLQQLLKSNGRNFLDAHNFRQVYGWDQNKPRVTTPVSFQLNESAPAHANTALWDFWESHPSSVLAAHVDAEHDCFSLWDSRQKPTVVIDSSFGRFSSQTTAQDHVTSCAFVSEFCLATSHVTWTANSSSLNGPSSSSVVECLSNGRLHKKPTAKASSRIQLWDLRMLRAQRQPLSSMAVVPSFPQDSVLGGSPGRIFSIGQAAKPKQNRNLESAVLNIQASKSCNSASRHSQVLVTTDSHSSGLQYHLLELAHGEITRTISHGQTTSGFMAVAPSQHAMVCSTASGTGDSLQVYNLLDQRHSSTARSTSGTKRSHLGQSHAAEAEANDRAGVKFTPVIKDRHGLSTQLSCLAMNYSGTSIMGGSIDGDLFLWR
ncbi:unnamed protein product [Cylindrotheca closterium]|uniref:Uncharacterized protein n=1 Tax=Cylindrotheca closterium TaxID=2856 RepID=A0AAD2FJV2_9STRA|nr:unnamed protein product [Cylindrotheca closterium]